MITFSFRRRVGACLAALAALGIAACSNGDSDSAPVVAQTVTVVGLDTDQSRVLTAIYAKALENGGFRVAHRDDVADLAAGLAALQSGAADLFVTESGQLLTYLADTQPAAASTSSTAAPTTTIAPTTTEGATSSTDDPTTTVKSTTTTAKSTASTATDATSTTITGAATSTSTASTSTDGTDTDDTVTDGSTGGSTDDSSVDSSTSVVDSTTTTISTAGQAAAVGINLQTNQIGEILPATLQLGAPSGAEDKPVIACVSTLLTGISNLTDLSRAASGLRIAGPADFETGDPYGLVGFENKFGGTFEDFVSVDAAKVAAAVTPAEVTPDTSLTTTTVDVSTSSTEVADDPSTRDADCGAFNSLDGTIPTTLTVLDDDQNWVPNNAIIPVLSAAGFTPGVSELVDRVSQAISTDTLREVIREVTVDGLAPSLIADSFLQSVGITS